MRTVTQDHSRYGERLATEEPPIDAARPPAERLASFVTWVAERPLDEEVVPRLLPGDGLRADVAAARRPQPARAGDR